MLAVLHLLLGVVGIIFTAHPCGTTAWAPVLAVSGDVLPLLPSGVSLSVINDQQLCLDVDEHQTYHPQPPER